MPTILTMVDMLQYDRNVVRVEGSTDQEVFDLDIHIETEKIQIVNDAFFDIVILSMLKSKFQLHHAIHKIV